MAERISEREQLQGALARGRDHLLRVEQRADALVVSIAAGVSIGLTAPSWAATQLHEDGTGFVTGADAMTALGWDDATLQANAASLEFALDAGRVPYVLNAPLAPDYVQLDIATALLPQGIGGLPNIPTTPGTNEPTNNGPTRVISSRWRRPRALPLRIVFGRRCFPHKSL